MNNNRNNRSKYLRDPNEKKKSKYLRDKDEKKSKYLKDSNTQKEHHYNLARNYREEEKIIDEELEAEEEASASEEVSSEIKESPENTEATANEASNTEEADSINEEPDDAESLSEENFESEEAAQSGEAEAIEEKEQSKGDISSLFTHSKMSKDTTVASVEDEEDARRKLIIKTVIIMTVLTVTAAALEFATIQLPFLPSMLSIEFSAFPELIASLAYGPVFGIFIVIIKNVFHILVANNGFVSELSNLILDSIYIFCAGYFYSKSMFDLNPRKSKKPAKKDKRRSRIFFGGFIGTVATTFVSFFLTRFVSYPLLIKQYSDMGVNEFYIINLYQEALDKLNAALPERISSTITTIDNLTQAILYYNVPFTFIKFLIITLVSALVYVIISPYLHFRKNTK